MDRRLLNSLLGKSAHSVQLINSSRLLPRACLKRMKRRRAAFLRAVIPPNGIGAEIGVQRGLLTHVILHHLRPQKLHLIDPWYLLGREWEWAIGNRSTVRALSDLMRKLEPELASGQVEINIGFDLSVLPEFPDNYFDWVYLDTSHTYENTTKELQLLKLKTKPGGIIAGDNCEPNPQHKFHGVHQAVTEFVAQENFERLHPAEVDMANQFALRAKSPG